MSLFQLGIDAFNKIHLQLTREDRLRLLCKVNDDVDDTDDMLNDKEFLRRRGMTKLGGFFYHQLGAALQDRHADTNYCCDMVSPLEICYKQTYVNSSFIKSQCYKAIYDIACQGLNIPTLFQQTSCNNDSAFTGMQLFQCIFCV